LSEQDQIPGEWHQWRGGVDTKLGNIEEDVDEIKSTQKNMTTTLNMMPADVAKAIKNGEGATPPGNGQPVTFKWMAEKVLLPIVILIASIIIGASFIGG